LFGRDKSVISRHLKNIFKEEELDHNSVVAKNATTANDGKTYQVEYYNLDAVISVGYRVNSKRGTQFRIWANQVLKEYLVKGYAINEERLKEQAEQFNSLKHTVKLLGNILKNKEPTPTPKKKGIVPSTVLKRGTIIRPLTSSVSNRPYVRPLPSACRRSQ